MNNPPWVSALQPIKIVSQEFHAIMPTCDACGDTRLLDTRYDVAVGKPCPYCKTSSKTPNHYCVATYNEPKFDLDGNVLLAVAMDYYEALSTPGIGRISLYA